MTLSVVLSKAPAPHKYKVVIDSKKTVRFGAQGYQDFTITKNEQAKSAYIARHRVREDWGDYKTSGFWAKHLLWNKPTLGASVKDVERRCNMDISMKQ